MLFSSFVSKMNMTVSCMFRGLPKNFKNSVCSGMGTSFCIKLVEPQR